LRTIADQREPTLNDDLGRSDDSEIAKEGLLGKELLYAGVEGRSHLNVRETVYNVSRGRT